MRFAALTGVVGLSLTTALSAAPPPPPTKPAPAKPAAVKPAPTKPAPAAPLSPDRQVLLLLAQLGSPDYAVRDKAALAIEELPASALPAIEAALAKGELSPEVAVRLAEKVSYVRRKSDATKYETMLRDYYVWDRDTALAAYTGGGHTNPKWDAAAREAIVLHVRPRRDPNISPHDVGRIVAAMKKAIDLGCDDPLVRMWHAIRAFELLKPDADPKPLIAEARAAAEGVAAGAYPAYLRMEAAYRHADIVVRYDKPTPENKKAVTADFDIVFSQVGPALKEGAPRHAIMSVVTPAKSLLSALENASLSRAHDRAMKAMAPAIKGTMIQHFLEADFRISGGYFVRNSKPVAGRPPEEKEKLLAKTVGQAKAAVDAGLKLDPDDSDAVNRMLRFLCLTRAPADEFDKWFDRAMKLYPNDLVACQMKHTYLQENGTVEQRLAFGRECLAGGNWGSRIPLILCDVHAQLGSDPRDAEVWADLTAAYEGYFKRFPNANADRSAYCYSACLADQWRVARTQFDALGDHLVWTFFNSQQQLDEYRKRAKAAR
ncbi:MAG: hypothetical protein ACAI43_15610 [Phycisphaerae bacterium]|nr:hypothetical protein [Tepidisphaeraceae bacterium]